MAVDDSLGAAFIELGIDLTRLESDFLAADQTIQQNLSRLNRERNLIELRAQVEIGGLEDAEQILDVKTRTLNQQLQIQRDKVLLVEAAFKQLANSQGASATATQNMEARLNRERLALQRLEQQLRQTTQAQANLNSSGTSSNNSNFSVDKLKGLFLTNFDSKLGKLSEALPAVGSLAEKATTALAAIPTPAKAAVVALTAIPIAIKTVENSLLSLAEPAISAGDAFYVASRGAQMSIKDFAQLSTVCKVTGIELSEVTTVMRRLNMQIVRGGESAAVKALKKFGVEVRNANGELKNAYEMSLALAEGLEKAQAAGKGKDFIAGILGRNATGDIVTYLEDLKGNIELAKTIVKNGLFDPVRAHNTQGLINTMNAQAAQLGSAFSSALLPIAEKLVPNITKRMGELTKVIADNANGIKNIANAVAEVADVVGTLAAKTVELGVKTVGTVGEALNGDTNAIIKNYGNATKEIKNEQDLFNAELAKMLPTQRAALLEGTPQYNLFKSQMKQQFKNLQKWREENVKSWADFRRADEQAMIAAKKANAGYTEEEEQASLKRAEKYAEELEKLQIEIDFANDSYGKAIANLDLNYRKDLNQDYLTDEEKTNLAELNAAKLVQIEQEKEKKLSDIRDKANEKFKTDLENQLNAIEKQKDEWISAGMEEAEAEELAQRQKVKAIEDLNAEIVKSLDSIWQNSLENRLAEIEREKQAWIQKGVDEVKATQWAEQQKVNAQRNAAMEVLKSQLEEYRAFQEGGYQGLKNYQREKLFDSGIAPEDLMMTPQQLAEFKKAQQIAQNSLLPNFMTDTDIERDKRLSDFSDAQRQRKIYADNDAYSAGDYSKMGFQVFIDGKDVTEEMLQEIYGLLPRDELQKSAKSLDDALGEPPSYARTPDYQPNFQPPEDNQLDISSLNYALGELKPVAENVSSSFDGLNPMIESAINSFDELTPQIADVTVSLGELIDYLDQAKQTIQNVFDNQQSNSTPPQVTINVTITEAHAWDYEHINDLAEKVADRIEPEIVNALGGNSNVY